MIGPGPASLGGRSTIRKALDIEFEGFTWPERFLVLSTLDPDPRDLLVPFPAGPRKIWPISTRVPVNDDAALLEPVSP